VALAERISGYARAISFTASVSLDAEVGAGQVFTLMNNREFMLHSGMHIY
jgi:hypothetical protein